MRPTLALALLASAALTACDDSAEPTTRDATAAAAPAEPNTTDAARADAPVPEAETDMPSTETADAFATEIVDALTRGDTAFVFDHAEGVGLPDGWQQMLGPFLSSMAGHDLTHEVRPVESFSRDELSWPEGDLPEALDEVKQILHVAYDETDEDGNNARGTLTLPLVRRDNAWKILLIGPDA